VLIECGATIISQQQHQVTPRNIAINIPRRPLTPTKLHKGSKSPRRSLVRIFNPFLKDFIQRYVGGIHLPIAHPTLDLQAVNRSKNTCAVQAASSEARAAGQPQS
jgi:hypothetical protein